MTYDSIARAGYYNVAGADIAHHTYVVLEREGVHWGFPCFGGMALREGDRGTSGVVYPADLWTPYMIGHQNVGNAMGASLFMALAMAQFTTSPATNWTFADWHRYWDANPVEEGVACHAGLVYAVNGVCHQACNRILWSTRMGDFRECPVNWPPSFSASYWVYGYWGKTNEHQALALAHRVASMVAGGAGIGGVAAAAEAPRPLAELAHRLTGPYGGGLLEPLSKEHRRHELKDLLAEAPAGDRVVEARTTMQGVEQFDQRFNALKAELDRQLLRGELANDVYAQAVNEAFRAMVTSLRDALPAATSQQLFGDVGDGYGLVSPALMPSSYQPIGDKLGL